MSKILLSVVFLVLASSAFADNAGVTDSTSAVLLPQNEIFCGQYRFIKPEDRFKYSFKAAILLDRPSTTFTQAAIDKLDAEDRTVAVWVTDSTFDTKNLVATMTSGSCYCVTADAGGMLELMGFEQITKVEPTTCVAQ